MVNTTAVCCNADAARQSCLARKRSIGGSWRAQKAAYLILRMITQEIDLIQIESLNECEEIGSEIMEGGKLSKCLKGYECIPGLF